MHTKSVDLHTVHTKHKDAKCNRKEKKKGSKIGNYGVNDFKRSNYGTKYLRLKID